MLVQFHVSLHSADTDAEDLTMVDSARDGAHVSESNDERDSGDSGDNRDGVDSGESDVDTAAERNGDDGDYSLESILEYFEYLQRLATLQEKLESELDSYKQMAPLSVGAVGDNSEGLEKTKEKPQIRKRRSLSGMYYHSIDQFKFIFKVFLFSQED